MRIVLQRSNHAKVSIDGQIHGEIDHGYVLLVGVIDSDGQKEIDYLVHKITHLRIFEDENGKMNRSINQVAGQILSISQFTLFADTKHGNRPSFKNAGQPDHAKQIYDQFNHALTDAGQTVATGVFGADMKVDLENDGPVTIIFDTEEQ